MAIFPGLNFHTRRGQIITAAEFSNFECAKLPVRWTCPLGPTKHWPSRPAQDFFSLLSELRRPAGIEELAERLALHPNGVRAHLERLREAALVARRRTCLGARGRPRNTWSIAEDAQPGGDRPSAYADLGRWLARIVSARASLRAVEATSTNQAQAPVPDPL